MTTPVVLSWSGGKDSALALQQLRTGGEFDVVALLTSVTRGYDRVSIHGVRRTLLEAQAGAIGLPLLELWLEPTSSDAAYQRAFLDVLDVLAREHPAVKHIAFGDLYLRIDRRTGRDRAARGAVYVLRSPASGGMKVGGVDHDRPEVRRLPARPRSRALIGTLNAFSRGMRAVPISTGRTSTLLAIALTAVACGSPPPLDKQLETLSSWTATMQLARQEHGASAITTTYATQLRDGAQAALRQAEPAIGQAAHSKTDSSYAAAWLDSLRTAIRQLNAETGS